MKRIDDFLIEKLLINKNTKQQKEEYWFTKDIGITLPFELKVYGKEIFYVTIQKIILDGGWWYLYTDNDEVVFHLSELTIKCLFIYNTHKAILKIHGFHDKVRDPQGVVVRYEDDKNKILNESQNQKIYSNIILLNPEEDKILILRRANYMKQFPGAWGFPGGHIDDKDKDPKEAAIRELKEETGIELSWNESNKLKEYDKIKHDNDNSICYYYIATLESNVDIKLSKEHAGYEWYNETSKKNHKWIPDVFQLIQKILE